MSTKGQKKNIKFCQEYLLIGFSGGRDLLPEGNVHLLIGRAPKSRLSPVHLPSQQQGESAWETQRRGDEGAKRSAATACSESSGTPAELSCEGERRGMSWEWEQI